MRYQNFKVAIYCTIHDLQHIDDLQEFEEKFSFIEEHLSCDKVYLETYRGNHFIDPNKLLKIKAFFEKRGIQTSGGFTPDISKNWQFKSFCYQNKEHQEQLKKIVLFTAGIFDEIILDDFYFTNCKCDACIQAKGDQSWAEYRTQLMQQISSEIIMKTAKEVNPKINMIIKYPNWYEDYQATGYNLQDEPQVFDSIYTGTETRNPEFTQQNLQRYTSYFLMRYLENVKPGCNGGGWFDPFDCMYNMGSYIEQAYLTLFSKSKEVTLFCLGQLLTTYRIFIPLAGFIFKEIDQFIGKLGNPIGLPCYKPYHSKGESYLHGYLGMIGLPLEPSPVFPTNHLLTNLPIILTESAKTDKEILTKIKCQLQKGQTVIITSGLLQSLQGRGIEEIAQIRYTDKKVLLNTFAFPMYECSFGNYVKSSQEILFPQIEFSTNDCIQKIVGFRENQCFPILLKIDYSLGTLYVLTIPENYGDLYHLPIEILNETRKTLMAGFPVKLEAEANIGLFAYDNHTFIIESFLAYNSKVSLVVEKTGAELEDLVTGERISGQSDGMSTRFTMNMHPTTYRVFRYV